eukprot:3426162-Pyramimonas_sp.AAC.1
MVGGDWNNQPSETFAARWAAAASATPFYPMAPTCRQALAGTVLVYLIVSSDLAAGVDSDIQVDEGRTLYPHCPVHLRIAAHYCPLWQLVPRLPKELPQEAPIGCARFPLEWDQGLFEAAGDAAGLAVGMDTLMHGIEKELTNRYDYVGPAAKRYAGRAGAPEFVWRLLKWQPPSSALTSDRSLWRERLHS